MPANSERREKKLLEYLNIIIKKYLRAESFVRPDDGMIVGVETELFLVQQGLEALDYNFRDRLVEKLNSHAREIGYKFRPFQEELGGCQVEITTQPINISRNGIRELVGHMGGLDSLLTSSLPCDCKVLRIGSHPLVLPSDYQKTGSRQKFITVPDFHNQNRNRSNQNGHLKLGISNKVDISDAAIIGLCCAVQATIDVYSFEEAIDVLNRSFMISPYAVAISSNARYLGGVDTEFSDMRFVIWELNHDTRTEGEVQRGKVTRVGLPRDYHKDMESYFQDLSSYPFILDTDLAGNLSDTSKVQEFLSKTVGLNWRDARIKFQLDSEPKRLLVEFRPLSTQASFLEDIACLMFYIGRLHFSKIYRESLISMHKVRQNKQQSMLKGNDGQLWYRDYSGNVVLESARVVLEVELERAIHGMQMIVGAQARKEDEGFIDLFTSTLTSNLETSPSERFHTCINSFLGRNTSNLRDAILMACKELNLVFP